MTVTARGPARAEPGLWALFAAGGTVAAFLMPVHAAILGIAYAAGWLPADALAYDRILDLARAPLVKAYLAVLLVPPLFHWAHRFRFILRHQAGIHRARRAVAVACYGTALIGTGVAIALIVRI
ncbi:MAG: fumarate reductase subunit FrdD [Actinomycetota bacterium]